MAKLSEQAATELPLNDERLLEPKKQNRHVVIALNHMHKRRGVLTDLRARLTKEIEELDAAILALG